MKFSKIVSAAAAIAAAGMMTVSANAVLTMSPDPDPGLSSAGGAMWLAQVYNVGNPDENKPATDYGIDCSKIAKVSVTVTIPDNDNRIFFDGSWGGAMVLSINGEDIKEGTDMWDKYNWVSNDFWGLPDEDLGFVDNVDATKALTPEKVGDYTYKVTSNVFENPLANGDASKVGCVQVAVQDWASSALFDTEIVKFEVLDASDNVLLTFDQNGKATVGGGSSSSTPAPSTGDSTPAASSGNNVDTGVESVAMVVGVAAMAAGAVVLSRKRK